MEIRPRRRDDDERLMEIYNQYETVFRMTVEEWRFHIDERAREEGKQPTMNVGLVDGEIVGDWYIEPHWSGASGIYFAMVEVDERKQGKGYGSELWKDAEGELHRKSVTKAYCQISEELGNSQNFAESKGFHKTGRADRLSRLELNQVNFEGYEGVEEKLTGEGITIKSVAEMQPLDEPFMRKMHRMVEEVVSDIPRTEKEHQEQPFEVWNQNFLKSPASRADAYFVALDRDDPIGLANLQIHPGGSTFNGLTGVMRAYRGRGVARALKMRTIQWTREQGRPYIDTANDATNSRMLAINISLGYKPLPAREEWLKEY